MQGFLILIAIIVVAFTFMFSLWSEGKGPQQAAALKPEDDEVSPLKDFSKKRACPRPAGLETETRPSSIHGVEQQVFVAAGAREAQELADAEFAKRLQMQLQMQVSW